MSNKKKKGTVEKASAPAGKNWAERFTEVFSSPMVMCGLALVVAYVAILTLESDYLKRVEELNLFLYTPLFFKQQLVVPGGLLTYLGTYFTQYFYHPWLGTLLLCCWLGLMTWLIRRTFGIAREWTVVLLLPIAMVLLTDFDLGYWLYYLKLRGHFFVAVIGVSMAVASTWVFRLLAVRAKATSGFVLLLLFFIAAAFCLYPTGGFYGLLAIVLMGLISWRIGSLSRMQKCILSAVAILLVGFTPTFYYRNVYYQTNSDFLFLPALPLYPHPDSFSAYHIPFVIIVGFLFAAALLYRLRLDLTKRLPRPWMTGMLSMLIAIITVWSCWHWWYKDVTFHEEIQMNACIDRGDWEGVLRIARQHEGEPTRMMVVSKNLALFKLGRAGNEMYAYRDGAKAPNASFDMRMAQMGGKNLYLQYGLPNYCYRWCLEDGVEIGWRVEHLKYLLRCSLLNGEWKVAKRYIDLLKQTKYYGEWAERYEPLATPDVLASVAKDPELGPIRRLMFDGDDRLGSDQSLIELFMLNLQAYRVTSDPVCAELALLSALQLKDISTFWRAFNQYALLKTDGVIPRYYQEAAYLYGNLEHNVDISRMPFDPSIPASYAAFMQAAQHYAGKSEEELKELLRARFGDTFYYNYFLMRNMKTY